MVSHGTQRVHVTAPAAACSALPLGWVFESHDSSERPASVLRTLMSERGTVVSRRAGESPGPGPARRAPLGGCYGNTHKHNRNKTGALLGNRSPSSTDTTVQMREPRGSGRCGSGVSRWRRVLELTWRCQGVCGAQWPGTLPLKRERECQPPSGFLESSDSDTESESGQS